MSLFSHLISIFGIEIIFDLLAANASTYAFAMYVYYIYSQTNHIPSKQTNKNKTKQNKTKQNKTKNRTITHSPYETLIAFYANKRF